VTFRLEFSLNVFDLMEPFIKTLVF